MMKKLWIIVFGVLISIGIWAEDSIAVRPNLLDSMPGVEVLQDSAVGVLLDEAMNGSREMIEIDGYRVQIYSSNQQQVAKSEALDLESKLKDKIEHTIYVQYLPPFWKVRLGDFRTYDEAKEYKKQFVEAYPAMIGDTYIVRDKIKVLQ
ncbi:MAG: SPOR domain-containing protein [Paludibacteraceae bacterium]|nr:SPOR domain-containing protein [Paludibacteraceae bacterium]